MSDVVYDLPIKEVAEMLDKSDRQVRRYVKEKKLKARAIRVDGHHRLMFNTEEVLAFKERFTEEGILAAESDAAGDAVLEARIVEGSDDGRQPDAVDADLDTADIGDAGAVKYVIDALREQISDLREENRELHQELQRHSGLIGFWQGKAELLQEEMKALMPAKRPEDEKKPWYRRIFGGG